jgi:hypothetical protein
MQIDREVSASNFELIDTLVDDGGVEEVERVVGDRDVKWEDVSNCSRQHCCIGRFGLYGVG